MASPQVFSLILAGGSGTRFWPLSRNKTPKQLLKFFDNETLIEKTVNRLDGLVARENILVLTNESQLAAIRAALPGIPPENIVAEPARRDTGPAVALAAGWVEARDPEAIMLVLPADQLVEDLVGFREILHAACRVAAVSDGIVTLGIKPDWPCPSYGYIERGEKVDIEADGIKYSVSRVRQFREKPSPEVAADYLAAGNFSWNAGVFVWSMATLKSELSRHNPELATFITELAKADDFENFVAQHFPNLTKKSIDFALMEDATCIYHIEADVGWDDVGGWPSLAKYFPKDEYGNAVRGASTVLESVGNIALSTSGKRIALLGVSDLIIVETDDAILVADRHKADDIKKLVDLLPEAYV